VEVQRENTVPTFADASVVSHQPNSLGGMRPRYRYRIGQTPEQRTALAKAFGCVRVVYNDGLRLREDAYRAGLSYVTDAELFRRVLTLASRPRSVRGSARCRRWCCNSRSPTWTAPTATISAH
jgi:helix-turn-helix protein